MSRFLFVVPPLVGHINPLTGVADRLRERGHEIAWAGLATKIKPLVGDAEIYDVVHATFAERAEERPDVFGAEALRFLWSDYLIPLAEAMVDKTAAAVRGFRPDVIVADQQAFAGALVAEQFGLPWATSASTSAELTSPYPPKVEAWIAGLLAGLRTRFGLTGHGDLRLSPHLVLAYTTEALLGPVPLPRQTHLVGPVLTGRPETGWLWPWPYRDRPTVLITMGTANKDVTGTFLTAAADAVAERGGALRAIIADPGAYLGPQPPCTTVFPTVPQATILSAVDAVLCHAGHNTVCESLWHGVPLVVAPIRDDQQIVAGQAVTAGAAERLRFSRANAGHIGSAFDTVLTDPAYRTKARHIRDSFRGAGGAIAAADLLCRLLPTTPHSPQ
ncbi:glycosyltransferase [Amycolatopsis speibonae]|uniref:Glycosyltransferase n=1 Tax=Amycolatopsis speibonae TaxID=1450224 RepID=A0ABV7P0S2_9PSEU